MYAPPAGIGPERGDVEVFPGDGPDDDTIYIMSVTEHDGTYVMVYTALGRAEAGRIQRIAAATSPSLVRWIKHPGHPVAEADPRIRRVNRGVPQPCLTSRRPTGPRTIWSSAIT